MFSNVLDELIEVSLSKPDDFLLVKETLNRIGVSSKRSQTLYPSVHILHKKGRYYLTHFKHLFLLEGKEADLSETDLNRYYTICFLLKEWGLVKILNEDLLQNKEISPKLVKIIPFAEKSEWTIVPKFKLGKKNFREAA